MTNPISKSARAAADRLATEFDPALVVEVEEALDTRNPARRPEQFFDPVSLGALVVSAATLAWKVYTDLKQKTPQPTRDAVALTVRVELRDSDETDPAQLDRIIDVVVDETIRTAEETG